MIRGVTIKNFKAIKGPVELELAPITLIYGPNSAGKSSIIQSLLLLKQSMEAPRKQYQRPELLVRGPFIDLGSYRSLLHGQNLADDELILGVNHAGDYGEPALFRSEIRFKPNKPAEVVADRILYQFQTAKGYTPLNMSCGFIWHECVPPQHFGKGSTSTAEPDETWGPQLREYYEGWSFDSPESAKSFVDLLLWDIATGRDFEWRQSVAISNAIEILAQSDLSESYLPDLATPRHSVQKHAAEWFMGFAHACSLRELVHLGPWRGVPARQQDALPSASSAEHALSTAIQSLGREWKNKEGTFNEWLRRLGVGYHAELHEFGDDIIGRRFALVLNDWVQTSS